MKRGAEKANRVNLQIEKPKSLEKGYCFEISQIKHVIQNNDFCFGLKFFPLSPNQYSMSIFLFKVLFRTEGDPAEAIVHKV